MLRYESGRQEGVVDPHDALPEQRMTVESELHIVLLLLQLMLLQILPPMKSPHRSITFDFTTPVSAVFLFLLHCAP